MRTTVPLPAPASERLHGLDAVRGLALLLGVALHLSMSYLPGAEYWWIVSDSDPSPALGGLFFVIHCFRMLLFFVIAGYFGRLALERRGWRDFVRDRLNRIVKPLLIGWPLVFTAIILVVVWAALIKNGGSLPKESPPGPKFTPDDFPLTHLWFLYVLTLLYGAALVLRFIAHSLDRAGRVLGGVDAAVRGLRRGWAPLLLALPLAAALASLPKWYAWFGIPTPDQSLYPNLAAATGFGTAFALGWLLQRQNPLLRAIEGKAGIYLAIAVAATAVSLSMVGLTPALSPAPGDATTRLYALIYATAGWAWTLALIGLALRHLSTHSPARRYLADASYWMYLVHLPLVMALQVATSLLDWPWWIEYPLALGVGLSLMLLSYHGMVRYTWIGAMLNGTRRVRTAAPSPSPAAHAAALDLRHEG